MGAHSRDRFRSLDCDFVVAAGWLRFPYGVGWWCRRTKTDICIGVVADSSPSANGSDPPSGPFDRTLRLIHGAIGLQIGREKSPDLAARFLGELRIYAIEVMATRRGIAMVDPVEAG